MERLNNLIFTIIIFIFIYGGWRIYDSNFRLAGESETDFREHIIKQEKTIKKICSYLKFNPRLLVAVLYAERRSNINLMDDYEAIFAYLGNNTSIGLGQIRVETARWILRTVTDSTSLYCLPEEFRDHLPDIRGRRQVIEMLLNDSLNIVMTAYHIKQILHRWESAGFPLEKRPDILTTLYTYGLYNRHNGRELVPGDSAISNSLGKVALELFNSNKYANVFNQY